MGWEQGWDKWEDDGFHGLDVGIKVWVNGLGSRLR